MKTTIIAMTTALLLSCGQAPAAETAQEKENITTQPAKCTCGIKTGISVVEGI